MDPIADLLNRIKNAQAAGHETVEVPFSALKLAIVKIMEAEGFLAKVEKKGARPKEKLEMKLRYDQGVGAIAGLGRVSKPGRRVYLPVKGIKAVKQGVGLVIISTSQGVMSGQEAKKKGVSGEVLCKIW